MEVIGLIGHDLAVCMLDCQLSKINEHVQTKKLSYLIENTWSRWMTPALDPAFSYSVLQVAVHVCARVY